MRRTGVAAGWRLAIRFLAATAAAALPWSAVTAQDARAVLLGVPLAEPLSPTPILTVDLVGFTAADRPLTIRLQASTSREFTTVVYDSLLSEETRVVVPRRLLPERSTLWFRLLVRTARGEMFGSGPVGPRVTGARLVLIAPTGSSGVTLRERRPTFVWSAAPILTPPGPWLYDFSLLDVSSGRVALLTRGLRDTVYVPPIELEVNRAYRWFVRAYTEQGAAEDTARAASVSSFVITPENAPIVTLVYQNFPNPFPTSVARATCIWFDLRRPSEVRLEILDLRGRPVRRLVPSAEFVSVLPAGRYGRAAEVGETGSPVGSGCDPRLAWDGSAEDGRIVPPGVYLLRFRGDGVESVRKIVFRGP